ncbi:ComEC/Rec2 family competence protein [Flagellimonas pacifica]|uniref:Metal-dependent hydrolase, beta-lactamase superfamily II n=1 Tax=Flagellimonas pacifica TaxID=1247520 RepID=A0A285MWT1_9FLAO|nr:MBL fold metallo-hydrolase [Allomuricauda parva]SNZ01659.1 Metal-dependent hydrolase, beta-lactamase superfamily II [Allomuricauda parva]
MTSKINQILAITILLFQVGCNSKPENTNTEQQKTELTQSQNKLKDWQKGYLDIHHINTGSGDATFFVLPDGTTMLFDAGSMDKEGFEEKYAPLKATSPVPDDSKSTGEWIAAYIKNVTPKKHQDTIDYALISHFHSDHYGSLMDLGKEIPLGKIIDRNSPKLDFPFDLKTYLKDDKIFQEYLSFISEEKVPAEALEVGSITQIQLVNNQNDYPNFSIRNIKSNATLWTGIDNNTKEHFSAEDMTAFYKGGYNENPLSLALKISYGNFDYFTGGDNTGLQGFGLPKWFDVETPMAKVVGQVEVTILNHHGNRDATNEFFVQALNPNVVIQQLWCSDHPGQEVYQRLIHQDEETIERDIFSTNMHPETLVTYGPWFKDNYKSLQGHIVVRVAPKGNNYTIYILDEATMNIKEEHGSYKSR